MKIRLHLALCLLLCPSWIFAQVSVLTQHNDDYRTGWNASEKTLNLKNVNSRQFGKAFIRVVDGQIYAQPLVVSGMQIGGGQHNVLIVATVNNSIYAFEADTAGHADPFWKVNLTPAGLRPILYSDMTGACGGNYNNFSSFMGIVGTPVIDTATHTMYVVARSVGTNGTGFVQYLHALDIVSGQEKANSPVRISAQVPGTGDGSVGGILHFDDQKENQRPGLLLSKGTVYIGYASHCDWDPYHGWLLGYDATTLQQTKVWVSTPDGREGGIWMSGAAPAADEAGNIYLATGNGTTAASPSTANPRNIGQSIVKLTPNATSMDVTSYFTPKDYQALNDADLDMGCFQVIMFPGTKYLVSGDKNGDLYLLDRDNMGGYHTGSNNILQAINIGPYSNLHASLGYYKGSKEFMYVWSENAPLFAFPFDRTTGLFKENEKLTGNYGPVGQTGGFLSISSDGSDDSTAILWASYPNGGDAEVMTTGGILRAFSAADINREIWNSSMDPDDQPASFAKFVCPTVANGKVYLATQSGEVAVYGLVTKGGGACDQPNVAQFKAATATSLENPNLPASAAVDGNPGTRWSSSFNDYQDLTIDLGQQHKVCRVVIRWETALGRDFNILYSADGQYWYTAKEIFGNASLLNNFSVDFTARYIKMQGLRRGTPYGFSIWEMEVYGKPVMTVNTTGGPRVYPNPAPDHFSVVRGQDEIQDVEVYDASGRMMSKTQAEVGSTEVEISTRGFARGVYMVKVNTAKGKYRIKVVH